MRERSRSTANEAHATGDVSHILGPALSEQVRRLKQTGVVLTIHMCFRIRLKMLYGFTA